MRDRLGLFGTGFLQVLFVAANTVFISRHDFALAFLFATQDGATGYSMTEISYISPMLGELRVVGDILSEQARNED